MLPGGNGALELLKELGVEDPTQLLGMLWLFGYKVVPLEEADFVDWDNWIELRALDPK